MTTLVRERLKGQIHDLGDGFMIRRLLPSPSRHAIGPFVFMDHLGPLQLPATQAMDVRPHPHTGLATVNTDSQVVLLGGAPLDAPRYLWWNHVASSEALLEEARQAWREQRYAMDAGDPEFIPLPDDGRATLRIEAD